MLPFARVQDEGYSTFSSGQTVQLINQTDTVMRVNLKWQATQQERVLYTDIATNVELEPHKEVSVIFFDYVDEALAATLMQSDVHFDFAVIEEIK